jgi:hypothetical protein
MAFTPDTQQGATIAFTGIATFIDAAVDIPEVQQKFPTIDCTHLGTTGSRRYIPADLSDVDEFTVKFQHDGSTVLPTLGAIYTVTITAPLATGDATAEKAAGTCIVTSIPTNSQFQSDTPALQVCSLSLKPDGSGTGGGTAWTRTVAS